MSRSVEDLLADIQEAAARAVRHRGNLNKAAFLADEKTIDAVVRCLSVLGEAAKQVSREERDNYPHLPWREMIGLRDRVVHDYLGLDLDIVWEVVDQRLPALLDIL